MPNDEGQLIVILTEGQSCPPFALEALCHARSLNECWLPAREWNVSRNKYEVRGVLR